MSDSTEQSIENSKDQTKQRDNVIENDLKAETGDKDDLNENSKQSYYDKKLELEGNFKAQQMDNVDEGQVHSSSDDVINGVSESISYQMDLVGHKTVEVSREMCSSDRNQSKRSKLKLKLLKNTVKEPIVVEKIPSEEQFKGHEELIELLINSDSSTRTMKGVLKILHTLDKDIKLMAVRKSLKAVRFEMDGHTTRWILDKFLKNIADNVVPSKCQKKSLCSNDSYIKREMEKDKERYIKNIKCSSKFNKQLYPELQKLGGLSKNDIDKNLRKLSHKECKSKGPYSTPLWVGDTDSFVRVKQSKEWFQTDARDRGPERDSWINNSFCGVNRELNERRRKYQEKKRILQCKRTPIPKKPIKATKTLDEIGELIGCGERETLTRCKNLEKGIHKLPSTEITSSMINDRDLLMYGEGHPMNDSLAPALKNDLPEERHQISLPARLRTFERNKKNLQGWFKSINDTDFIKGIPHLKVMKNPKSCDDHQFIKIQCDKVLKKYYKNLRCEFIKKGWNHWYELKTHLILSPIQLVNFRKTYNAYTPCLIDEVQLPNKIVQTTDMALMARRKRFYSPLHLIDGPSRRHIYKPRKECYTSRVPPKISEITYKVQDKWNKNF